MERKIQAFNFNSWIDVNIFWHRDDWGRSDLVWEGNKDVSFRYVNFEKHIWYLGGVSNRIGM